MKTLQDTTITDSELRASAYAFPCSVVQSIAWFLDRMSPGTPMMNIAVRVRLEGPLRAELLREAFREILARHEILRTTFQASGGTPQQLVRSEVNFDLPQIDLRSHSEEERAARAERLAAEEALLGFDIETGPLFRAKLLQIEAESFVLLLTMHHMISDGWSIGIVTNELGEIYEALAEGRRHTLEPLAIQYGDYACWQQEWMASDEYDLQLAELKTKLDGFPPLVVPTDHHRPSSTGGAGQIRSTLLPRSLTDTLKRLSDRQGCTLFVTMFSAFAVLMQKESGQSEIVIRTQAAGRDRVELEPLIGWLVNSLVLRNSLSGEITFLELMDRVKRTVLDTFEYQDVPFESLMEVLRPAPGPPRHPPFQVNFIFQRDLVAPWRRAGVTMTPIPSKAAGTFCDLNFFLVERADGWRASVDVNGDVFDAVTGERLLASFRRTLELVAQNPGQSIAAMDVPRVSREVRPSEAVQVAAADVVEPRSGLEARIAAIWEDVLRVKPVGVTTNFVDLGGHSLLAVPLLVRVKQEFGLSIPLAQLFAEPTVEAMARAIERPETAPAVRNTIPIQPAGSRHPFFMIGGDHFFRPLAKRLGNDQPFLGLSLQRYEERTEPASFSEIGRDLAELIMDEYPSGPYCLGGWCVDGAVAYEVAQHLVAHGKQVSLVVLMDSIHPPYRRSYRSKRSSVVRVLRRSADLVRDAKQRKGAAGRRLLRTGLRDLFERIWGALRPQFGTSEQQDQAIMQNDPSRQEFRQLLYRSEDEYFPSATRVPLLLIRSRVDRYQDSDLGWRQVALGGLETVEVTGDHIGMFREPEVGSLAAILWKRLAPLS